MSKLSDNESVDLFMSMIKESNEIRDDHIQEKILAHSIIQTHILLESYKKLCDIYMEQ